MNKQIQLQIYYLYMMADSKCTDDEMKKFDSICEIMKIEAEEKEEIIKLCNEEIIKDGGEPSTAIINIISNILEQGDLREEGSGFINIISNILEQGDFRSDSKKNFVSKEKICARTIWNLINLGYADGEYSEPEKKIVAFLVKHWEVDDVMVADMLDTAETMLALTNQQEWAKKTNWSYDVITKNINKIEEYMDFLVKDIEYLLTEESLCGEE